MKIWILTDNGYVADATDLGFRPATQLRGNSVLNKSSIITPCCRHPKNPSDFQRQPARGPVICWSAPCCGRTLTILNA